MLAVNKTSMMLKETQAEDHWMMLSSTDEENSTFPSDLHRTKSNNVEQEREREKERSNFIVQHVDNGYRLFKSA